MSVVETIRTVDRFYQFMLAIAVLAASAALASELYVIAVMWVLLGCGLVGVLHARR